jgi:arylsulfatase A-like enzyme
MMSAMDDAIGKVMAKIRSLGEEESTLVFFIADNGGPTSSTTSSNGVLRGFKSTLYEGGPRVPFIAQWKGKIPAGKSYVYPVVNLDVLPTIVTAAGGKVDPSWKLDGVDLVPYLTGSDSTRPHETLYWRFGEQWAVRHGDWKLVVARGGSGTPELYNLASDPGESQDLAAKDPEKSTELKKLWDAWSSEQAAPSATDAAKNEKKNKNKKRKGA